MAESSSCLLLPESNGSPARWAQPSGPASLSPPCLIVVACTMTPAKLSSKAQTEECLKKILRQAKSLMLEAFPSAKSAMFSSHTR